MQRLTTLNRVTLHLAWSDFSPLIQALHLSAGNEVWTVAVWGQDRVLCERLQQVWESTISAANAWNRRTVGGIPGITAACLQEGDDFAAIAATNLLILAASLQAWIQVEPLPRRQLLEMTDQSRQKASAQDDESWQVTLSFDPVAISRLLTLPAIAAQVPAGMVPLTQTQRTVDALQTFWAHLLQLPHAPPVKSSPFPLKPPFQPVSTHSLLKQAPLGVLHMGLDGGIVLANPAFCKLTGYSEAQLRHLDNRAISYPEDFAAEVRLIQHLVEGEQRQYTLQKRYLCCDGSLLWAEVKLCLITTDNADEDLILVFVTDLSDRKQAEREQARLLYQLQTQTQELEERVTQRTKSLMQSLQFEHLIHQLTETLRTELDEDQMLKSAVEGLVKTLGADGCISSLFNPQSNSLEVRYECFKDTPPSQSFVGQAFLLTRLSAEYRQSILSGKTYTICFTSRQTNELQGTDPILERFSSVDGPHARWHPSGLCRVSSPIIDDQGLIGVLTVFQLQHRHFEPDEVSLIEQVASQCAIALRQAHLYRQQHEQRLSAEHFRLFLEKSTDVFVEYGPDLSYISINTAGCDLLRLPAEKILGKTNRELLGAVGENLESLIRRAFETKERVFVDHEISLPEGARVFETVYAPIISPTGAVQRVIGICRDVTELKLQWQLLETQNHQLAETTRLKEEFVATTSHELRTPLTAILGFSNVLLQEFFGELNSKQKDYLERIHTSGQHLLDLINDILDLSRLEADRLELDLQTIFVPDICEGVISLIHERAVNQGLNLEIDLDRHVDWMVADPRRLKQMLLNLLMNAVKFTQEGTVGLKVYLQPDSVKDQTSEAFTSLPEHPAALLAGTIHFEVWDTGIGIDKADQNRLFTPFAQIDSSLSRKHQGTGLGLVITRKLAELHGGSVTLESRSYQGAKFIISLPMRGDGRGEG